MPRRAVLATCSGRLHGAWVCFQPASGAPAIVGSIMRGTVRRTRKCLVHRPASRGKVRMISFMTTAVECSIAPPHIHASTCQSLIGKRIVSLHAEAAKDRCRLGHAGCFWRLPSCACGACMPVASALHAGCLCSSGTRVVVQECCVWHHVRRTHEHSEYSNNHISKERGNGRV